MLFEPGAAILKVMNTGHQLRRPSEARQTEQPPLGGYKVLGTTKDGVKILKPKGRATHFTDKELREAIATVRSAQKAG